MQIELIITPANELRYYQDDTKFEAEVRHQMQLIKEAHNRGFMHCIFSVDPDYYYPVKEEFARMGYTFHPTGEIGGVRQDTEDIWW